MNDEEETNFRLSLMGSKVTIGELCEIRRLARALEMTRADRLSAWLRRYARFLEDPSRDFPEISFVKWTGLQMVVAADDLLSIADQFSDESWAGQTFIEIREMLICELLRRAIEADRGAEHEQ